MKITEVKVKLMLGHHKNLLGFCAVILDGEFLVKDIKIIDSGKGPFISMPSRKLTDRCPRCRSKNHLRARYCNECGCRLDENRALIKGDSRPALHIDLAHPLTQDLRSRLATALIAEYQSECGRIERDKMQGTSTGEDAN